MIAYEAVGWLAFIASVGGLLASTRSLRRHDRWGWVYLLLGLALGGGAISMLRPIVASSVGI